MNIILLSGGSGKRLWPLSNDIRSKQFIKIFKTKDGYESMVQRIYSQIKSADENASITIATARSQVSAIHNQLGDSVNICVEPCRRDTFPAIALAAAYLHDILKVNENEPIVVCPVDPYVDNSYFDAVRLITQRAAVSEANLVLMGIEPTYPSEKYGYIIPEDSNRISKVKSFKEKPSAAAAEQYIFDGALWNGGVFAFRLGYLLSKAHELINFSGYEDLFANYADMPKISFDYAVVENEPNIEVMRYVGEWKDLGTWNTLTEAMEEPVIGNAILGNDCHNVHIINELDVPILCMGMKNCVIAASAEGVLVTDKEQSSYIKPFVDNIHGQVMFAEKSWGSYRVIDVREDALTVLVTLNAGSSMNYHSHERRDEVWTVISGTGIAVIDGVEQDVAVGDVITMRSGCRHMIRAKEQLGIIEVQLGKDISVKDKIKYN